MNLAILGDFGRGNPLWLPKSGEKILPKGQAQGIAPTEYREKVDFKGLYIFIRNQPLLG